MNFQSSIISLKIAFQIRECSPTCKTSRNWPLVLKKHYNSSTLKLECLAALCHTTHSSLKKKLCEQKFGVKKRECSAGMTHLWGSSALVACLLEVELTLPVFGTNVGGEAWVREQKHWGIGVRLVHGG